MKRLRSFPAIADTHARILILGSMPGAASLAAHQYYAHPQNQFWRIMAALTGTPREAPYAERVEALCAHGIALWDVLFSCEREGSLDSRIRAEKPNDFGDFFAHHKKIARVFFNGGKAEQSFRRHVLPVIETKELILTRLPSTSPAHAGLRFEEKRAVWEKALMRAQA